MSTPQTDEYGDRYWLNSEGQLHREDGPAVECADGSRAWYLNDQLHREDGPALEWANGYREWWLKGEELTWADWLDKTTASPQLLTLLRLRWT
jgi:hypothetical protein